MTVVVLMGLVGVLVKSLVPAQKGHRFEKYPATLPGTAVSEKTKKINILKLNK